MNKLELPSLVTGDFLEEILIFAIKNDVSDLHFLSENYIKADQHGRIYEITERTLSNGEIAEIAKKIYNGENIITLLNQADYCDIGFVIRHEKIRRRFRVNITACQVKGKSGIQITIRPIIETPKTLEELKVEKDIYENCFPSQGIVFVTGPTGSGKSTLLSALINHHMQENNVNKKIITLESPIETTYDHIKNSSAVIVQTEIPTNQKSFLEGIESALRRKPNIILIGELKDKETINAALMAAETGHLVLTTLHTNGVGPSFRRLLAYYNQEEREEKMASLIDSTKMIITQRLQSTVDGKRKAIKEYLVFDRNVKERLYEIDFKNISIELNKIVKEKKQSMFDSAMYLFENDLITKDDLENIKKSY